MCHCIKGIKSESHGCTECAVRSSAPRWSFMVWLFVVIAVMSVTGCAGDITREERMSSLGGAQMHTQADVDAFTAMQKQRLEERAVNERATAWQYKQENMRRGGFDAAGVRRIDCDNPLTPLQVSACAYSDAGLDVEITEIR